MTNTYKGFAASAWRAAALLLTAVLILASCAPGLASGAANKGDGETAVRVSFTLPAISPALASVLKSTAGSKALSSKAYCGATSISYELYKGSVYIDGGNIEVGRSVYPSNVSAASLDLALSPGTYSLSASVYNANNTTTTTTATAGGSSSFTILESDTEKTITVRCTPTYASYLNPSTEYQASSYLPYRWSVLDGAVQSLGSETWVYIVPKTESTRVEAIVDTAQGSMASPIMLLFDQAGVFLNGGPGPFNFASSIDSTYYLCTIDCGSGGTYYGFTVEYYEPTSNTAPGAFSMISPDGSALIDPASAAFSCGPSTDAEGDTLTYTLQVDTDSSFTSGSTLTYPMYYMPANDVVSGIVTDLDQGIVYYWRVKANDGLADTYATDVNGNPTVWSFTTNRPPVAAITPSATSIESEDSVTLTSASTEPDGQSMQFYWYVNGTRDEKADNYESYSWTLTQTTTFTLVVYDIPTGCESQAAVTITVTPPQAAVNIYGY